MADEKKFSGLNYKNDEFSPDERAGIREMWSTLSKEYIILDDDTVDKMRSLAGMARSAVSLAKILAVAAPIGAAAAIWVKLGGVG